MTTLMELDELTNPTDPIDRADRIVTRGVPVGSPPAVDATARRRARAAEGTGAIAVRPQLETVRRGPAGTRHHRAPCYVAPSRFDVHVVADFSEWVAAATATGVSTLVVDCSDIDFIDLSAIEALAAVGRRHDLELADLSLAALVTFRLLGSTVGLDDHREMAVAA